MEQCFLSSSSIAGPLFCRSFVLECYCQLFNCPTVFNSLGQLVFGWVSDCVRSVHSLTLSVLLISVSDIGVASFHLQATAQAANFVGWEKTLMSLLQEEMWDGRLDRF